MWAEKKALFTAPERMTLVTPSEWLKGYVEQSYLSKYPVKVIPNGIDLSVFYPREVEREEKKLILGVAASWTPRKGLEDFYRIDERLDHEKYQIVLVGLNDRQLQALPKTIRGMHRTSSADELAELYSKADVFVNPTYQDNYPTVNLEALACGTPVVTYRTGGSPESVPKSVGRVVEKGDIESLYDAVMTVADTGLPFWEICSEYARENFGKNAAFEKYVAVYEEMIG